MTSVFITGAHGFLGRALADRYRAAGAEVHGVDLQDGVDVAVPGPWQDQAARADLVLHTAAAVTLAARPLDAIYRANVLGTRNVLEAATGRLVHLSTVVTFGFDFPDGVTEADPVRVTGLPYGDTKIAAEHLLLASGSDVVIVRPGDVYGPRSRAWATLPAQLIRDRRFALPARGIFSPVYVDDLLDGIERAAATDAATGQIITLSGGVGVPNREFFAAYAELVGRRLPLVPGPVALAGATARGLLPRAGETNPFAARYMDRRGTYSIAKARELLGWTPQTPVDEGLRRTVAWLSETL